MAFTDLKLTRAESLGINAGPGPRKSEEPRSKRCHGGRSSKILDAGFLFPAAMG